MFHVGTSNFTIGEVCDRARGHWPLVAAHPIEKDPTPQIGSLQVCWVQALFECGNWFFLCYHFHHIIPGPHILLQSVFLSLNAFLITPLINTWMTACSYWPFVEGSRSLLCTWQRAFIVLYPSVKSPFSVLCCNETPSLDSLASGSRGCTWGKSAWRRSLVVYSTLSTSSVCTCVWFLLPFAAEEV